jgi:hypothetical protein
MEHRDRVLFSEVQRFNQPWVWAIILPVSLGPIALFGYGVARQIFGGVPWGDQPMSDIVLLVAFGLALVFGALLLLLFSKMRLVVVVQPGVLLLRFAPLHRDFRRIDLGELESHRACTYRPIREYGGWGIRFVPSGRAYNISGNQGVRLDYPDGSHVLIGSRRSEELARAVEDACGREESEDLQPDDGGSA